MNKYYFIPVNFNGFNFTKEYIRSVNNLIIDSNDVINIFVVDNKSDDEELRALAEYCNKFDNIKLVKNTKNLGYFRGINEGIKQIEFDENTILIIGNNDLTFDKNFVKNLKKINYDCDTMVLVPDIVTVDGRHQNPHVVNKFPLISIIKSDIIYLNYYFGQFFYFLFQKLRVLFNKVKSTNSSIKDNALYNKKMFIKMGIGACYILTPNFFRKYSLLDAPVFMWGEEAILAHQVEKVNGKTFYDNSLIVHHHESASVKTLQSKKRYKLRKDSYKIHRKYLK